MPLTLPRVELRKQVDTRAGRGLLIAIGVLTALALGLFMWVARNDGAPLSAALAVTTPPPGSAAARARDHHGMQ
ncbi:hypothetical protein M3694_08910 [Kocuria marina]|uniref:hypothetical protein n=1 Tax=Kocuria marina TaxID=223184 RepID=UPI001DE71FA5|nr:hypothetical protein [Kocuria marina]MBX7556990.1 hypothetical protein [Streptomyces sp. tea 10]MCT2361842.1 hypothetical protein [Kocuria marina]